MKPGIDFPLINFTVGKKYIAAIPFWGYERKNGIYGCGPIRIVTIIQDGSYRMIVYKVYGKHKQWWHYFIESHETLSFNVYMYEKQKTKQCRTRTDQSAEER